jgi:hypothetical protein
LPAKTGPHAKCKHHFQGATCIRKVATSRASENRSDAQTRKNLLSLADKSAGHLQAKYFCDAGATLLIPDRRAYDAGNNTGRLVCDETICILLRTS